MHHIDLLHGIGNELGALKRHYKSYIRLVDRVTEPQSSTLASRAASRVPSKASRETFDESELSLQQQQQTMMGVGLTSAAIVRFERLKDMISLYALAECKDYLHQKDALVQMVSFSFSFLIIFPLPLSPSLSPPFYSPKHQKKKRHKSYQLSLLL
jgi:hypothetical protein